MKTTKILSKPHVDTCQYNIQSVERATAVLKAFLTFGTELSASEIWSNLHLHPTTAFRMLATLENQGFVRRDPVTGKYRLDVVCLELGSQFLKANHLRDAALGVMTRLQEMFGETVHLGILDGDEIVYMEKLPSLRPIGTMASRVGDRVPAHCTALGKAILAYLPEPMVQKMFPFPDLHSRTKNTITNLENLKQELIRVKLQEYAIDNQENEEDVMCIAVPIFDHKGIVAALSISGPAKRMEMNLKENPVIDEVRQAAVEISTQLGWGRGVDQIQIPGKYIVPMGINCT